MECVNENVSYLQVISQDNIATLVDIDEIAMITKTADITLPNRKGQYVFVNITWKTPYTPVWNVAIEKDNLKFLEKSVKIV